MDKDEIKKFREKHGLNQSQLAEIAEVKVGTVQSWEQGKRNISKAALKLLQNYNNVLRKEKTPPGEVRFEDLLADRLMDRFNDSLTAIHEKLDALLEAASKYDLDMDELKDSVEETKQEVIRRS